MCVARFNFFFVLICACTNVKFWDNTATLPKTSFTFPPLSSHHFHRKRFLANLWCRITGLKSRVAALICHINLLTSVSVVTHNSAGCDMWSMGLVYRLTLPLTQIFFISVTSNLAPLCLLHYLYFPLTHTHHSVFWAWAGRASGVAAIGTPSSVGFLHLPETPKQLWHST